MGKTQVSVLFISEQCTHLALVNEIKHYYNGQLALLLKTINIAEALPSCVFAKNFSELEP